MDAGTHPIRTIPRALHRIARFQQVQHAGGLADGLHHDGHGALFGVRGGDGDRDTFTELIQPEGPDHS